MILPVDIEQNGSVTFATCFFNKSNIEKTHIPAPTPCTHTHKASPLNHVTNVTTPTKPYFTRSDRVTCLLEMVFLVTLFGDL